MSIPTLCHRCLTVWLFRGSSYHNSALSSHCSHIYTQSLTSMYISGHQYRSSTFDNIPSHWRRPLSSCKFSIAFHLFALLTNAFAGSSLVFHLWWSNPSKTRYFVVFSRNCCIFFGVFPSGCIRFPRNLPITFHHPLYSSRSLNPTNGAYDHSLLFLSEPYSSHIPHNLAWIVSSGSFSTSGPGTSSPWGHHERPSGHLFSISGWCFTSKSNSRIHVIHRASSAPGRFSAGTCSWYTNLVASVSTRDLTPYT